MVSLSSSADEHEEERVIDTIVETVTKLRHKNKKLFKGISTGRTKTIVRAVSTETRKLFKGISSGRTKRIVRAVTTETRKIRKRKKNQTDSSDESKLPAKDIWPESPPPRQTPKRKCKNEKTLNYKEDSSSDNNNSDTKRLKQEHSPILDTETKADSNSIHLKNIMIKYKNMLCAWDYTDKDEKYAEWDFKPDVVLEHVGSDAGIEFIWLHHVYIPQTHLKITTLRVIISLTMIPLI